MVSILTHREMQIMNKRLKGLSLSQNESNILSKAIRPKLEEISKIDAISILSKLEYNQKARSIENKIKEVVLKNVPQVASIVLCGSAVQTNYKQYKDIDIIVGTKKIIYNNKGEKYRMMERVIEAGKKAGLSLDVQIYSKKSVIGQYPHSPSLIYQLKDSKAIYGKLQIPKKITLTSLDLRMKLDWSDIVSIYSSGEEIYQAIRNAVLVLLLMSKKVDNSLLMQSMIGSLGAQLVNKLKSDTASREEKKTAMKYLKLILSYMENELKKPEWEKIEISNP